MAKIATAVIGTGGMAQSHLENVSGSERLALACVCDVSKERADEAAARYGVKAFYDYRELIAAGGVEAVIVATPHYFHTPISIDALAAGLHVLVEKPIAVHAQDASRMIEAYVAARRRFPSLVFSAMFMQRTYGYWRKIKDLIDTGTLGKLVRTTWIITDWYRTQAYYDTGAWRATWRGEGGGVLLNQCPHNLDLYQWLVGMPKVVRGFVTLGKYHRIEVEDEVTAYLEHENGMVGHFVTSTGESPGTNRLEIVGENGRLVFENQTILFAENARSMLDDIRTSKERFAKVPFEEHTIAFEHHGEPGHRLVIENFARAVQDGEPLIAPAQEGHASVVLANAILKSSLDSAAVELPLDEAAYAEQLQKLIDASPAGR
jgi:predicted dehydrogenase